MKLNIVRIGQPETSLLRVEPVALDPVVVSRSNTLVNASAAALDLKIEEIIRDRDLRISTISDTAMLQALKHPG
ncbi:hypothetical protein [Oleomonas cavernae]|uniref:hypothetical protein n=1 Tax=Oleomonas cavernae TaxID=2320859 RepID=UPI0011C390B0|nr:hypothetical protein [Oleomonas cavernae]